MVKKTEKITIGLEKNQALLISQKLNVLLASYSVLGINLRGYHWNVRGVCFLTFIRNLNLYMLIWKTR